MSINVESHRRGSRYTVAAIDAAGRVVGFRDSVVRGDEGFVRTLEVNKQYRRQGIASRLTKLAREENPGVIWRARASGELAAYLAAYEKRHGPAPIEEVTGGGSA